MLDRELAEKLIAQVTKYTEYNVNIIDENGIIIASRDRERLGTYHETAYEILRNGKDVPSLRKMIYRLECVEALIW